MKKIILVFLCVGLIAVSITGCGLLDFSLETNSDKEIEGSVNSTPPEINNEYLSDGAVDGTNAKTIENTLKSNSSYNWWDDHSLMQSQINKEWSVYCANNEYNTYTKSYELSAKENLEIEIAKFATYDNDINYLLACVDFFDTEYINAAEVKQWVLSYDAKDGYVSKTFGDAEFVLNTEDYDDSVKLELSIYALD